MIVTAQSERNVLADYGTLRDRLADKKATPITKDREVFERMVGQRRDVVRDGFIDWVGELDADSCKALGIAGLNDLASMARTDKRLEPVPPEFALPNALNIAHVIRKLGLGHEDEDRVVYLAKRAVRIRMRKGNQLQRELCLTKKRKLIWVDASPGRVVLMFAPDVSQDHRQEVVEALELEAEGESVPDSIPLKPVPDFQPLLSLMQELGQEIEAGSGSNGTTAPGEKRRQFWAGFRRVFETET